VFTYSDNGKGLPAIVNAGHGLKSMEARVNIIGGELKVGNGLHGGFEASIRIHR
jgi:signal transduction histidine kinase